MIRWACGTSVKVFIVRLLAGGLPDDWGLRGEPHSGTTVNPTLLLPPQPFQTWPSGPNQCGNPIVKFAFILNLANGVGVEDQIGPTNKETLHSQLSCTYTAHIRY